jgi:hypothetical protein
LGLRQGRISGSFSTPCGISGFNRLIDDSPERKQESPNRNPIGPRYEYVSPWHVLFSVLAFIGAMLILCGVRRKDVGDFALAFALIFASGTLILTGHRYYYSENQERQPKLSPQRQSFPHNSAIVPQKPLDIL